jgi:DNA-binding NarL/FixJ family response regulator
MAVVVLTSDIACGSQVAAAAKAAGATCSTALGPKSLAEKAPGCSLVMIDLTTPGLDIAAVAQSLRALNPPPRIVAFGPHVHEERLQAAADAGCDVVLSRGQFYREAEQLIRQAE